MPSLICVWMCFREEDREIPAQDVNVEVRISGGDRGQRSRRIRDLSAQLMPTYFLRDHLGHPIPSPALFAPMLDRFVGAMKTLGRAGCRRR
jgi:hypothetical protein